MPVRPEGTCPKGKIGDSPSALFCRSFCEYYKGCPVGAQFKGRSWRKPAVENNTGFYRVRRPKK